jgi:hypothetical protein
MANETTTSTPVAERPTVRSAASRCAVGAVAPVVAVVLALSTVTPGKGPVIAPDEMGFLAGARHLARAGGVVDMTGLPFYSIGWPVVAAVPARLFSGDAQATYTATVILQIALLAATALLAQHLVRSVLGADPVTAAVAATVAIAIPSAVVNTRFVWSETFLMFGVTATLCVLWHLLRSLGDGDGRRGPRSAAAAGVGLAWLPVIHGRLWVGAAATAFLVVAMLVAHGRRRWSAWFLTGAAVATTTGRLLAGSVRDSVWQGEVSSNGATTLRGVSSVAELWQTFQVAFGHLWAFMIGSAGLGLAALVAAWATVAAADGPVLRRAVATPRARLAILTLVLFVGTLITEAAFFSGGVFENGSNRQDHFLYGRYLDVFQPAVMALGAAACLLAARSGRPLGRPALVAVTCLLAVHLVVDVVGNNELAYGAPFNPFTSLNLARYGTLIDRALVETTVALALGLAGLEAVRRASRATPRRVGLLIAVPALPVIALGLLRWHGAVGATDGVDYADAQAVVTYLDRAERTDVVFDGSLWVGDRLFVQYWAPDLVVERGAAGVTCDDLPTEQGPVAVVTDPLPDADFTSGRLSVVHCDPGGDTATP